MNLNHLISAIILIISLTWAFRQQKDKLLHYLICASVTILFINVFNFFHIFWWFSPILAILIGIGKEIYDYFHPKTNTCDIKDFFADLIGITTITIVYLSSWVLYK